MKKTFYMEIAYIIGIIGLSLGAACMEKADFGVSMVIAPAYLVFLKLSQVWGFVTFGMAEYTLQAVLLLAMVLILRKFKLSYLFSFITAVLYGMALDGFMALIAPIDTSTILSRALLYIVGMGLCAIGVAMFFHTYITPGAYELFVKQLAEKTGMEIHRFKIAYDCVSCLVAVLLSFLFFGFMHFEGVKWGTVICAFLNGRLIGAISHFMEKRYVFSDRLPLKKYFEQASEQMSASADIG